jgi:hypothetical protein
LRTKLLRLVKKMLPICASIEPCRDAPNPALPSSRMSIERTCKMKNPLALLLSTALLSAAAHGQMMGGPLATPGYLPLVDGARYDYVHAGGPWASSTMVVRGGQAWAGRGGLYAMHYTYSCNAGATCAPDATEFYGMGPDGVHYYGGTGADPSGARFSMTSLTNPEWVLRNPVVPGTMMGGGGYAGAGSWTASVQGTGSMMGAQGYMSTYFAQNLETVTTPAGTFANALHVREQRGDGTVRDVWYAPGVGMVMMDDGRQVMRLSGYTIPGAAPQPGAGAAALPFMPDFGLWWNPEESGSGYNLQVRHGVMVVTVFSYAPGGEPVWYYAPGRLAAGGGGTVTFSSMLDRYRGGQCAQCPYTPPFAAGSDGAFSIVFASPVSATVYLPGGRTTRIEPQPW